MLALFIPWQRSREPTNSKFKCCFISHFPDAFQGPHPPLEYESSSHETENDPVIDGSLDSRESVVWNPGNMVRAVSGGRDVQAILDSPGLKLGVVNWHAAWVDSCIDILPFMER